MKLLQLLILLVLSGFPTLSTAQIASTLDAIFLNRISTESVSPGVAVAVIKDRQVVYKNTFGYANLEYEIPLSGQSVFDIASLAKQFTGFAIAQLIIEEQLSEETAVIDLLPELEHLPSTVKVKHLIHHTSGIRDIGELFAIGTFGERFTASEAIEILKQQKTLNFEVGTESDYSNSNYVLLALIVERITGQSFRQWCQRNIFSPLEMTHSFANDNDLELIKNRTAAYYSTDEGYSYLQNNGMSLIGSSAVYATIDDMSQWAIVMQGQHTFDPIFKKMMSKGKTTDGELVGYGYGLGLNDYYGRAQIAHTGSTPSGFRSVFTYFPSENLTLVMLSNWGDIDLIDDFGKEILKLLLPSDSEIPAPNADTELKDESTDPIDVPIEILDQVIGDYLFNQEMSVQIRRSGDDMTIAPEGQAPLPLIPLGNDRFDFPAFHSILEFEADESGAYNSAVIYAGPKSERHGTLDRLKNEEVGEIQVEDYLGQYYSEEIGMLLDVGSNNGTLELNHAKHGKMALEKKSLVIFRPVGHLASSVEFEKNDAGKINGLTLKRGSRLRALAFEKVNLQPIE